MGYIGDLIIIYPKPYSIYLRGTICQKMRIDFKRPPFEVQNWFEEGVGKSFIPCLSLSAEDLALSVRSCLGISERGATE